MRFETSRFVALIAVAATLTACGPERVPGPSPEEAEAAAETITAEDFRDRISVLAHDSMRGRDTPSPELDQTAAWIAAEFAALGLEPGAGDGYLQHYELHRIDPWLETSALSGTNGTLRWVRDLLPAWTVSAEREISGGIAVLSGSGQWRETLEVGGAALRGKHVILVTPDDGLAGGASRMARVLRNMGVASIIGTTDVDDESWTRRVEEWNDRLGLTLPWDPEPRPLYLQVRESGLRDLLALHNMELDELKDRWDSGVRVQELSGRTLDLIWRTRTVAIEEAPNVVGVLPGGDPTLSGEYVIYSAHMDHLGVGSPDENGDSIFNGADDNASGTAAVLELAEAFASLSTPPRRSIAFLLVSGEEKGLWGSEYYAENPTLPVDSIVANINIDMIGRNWSDTIVAIGKEHSSLGATLEAVNAEHPELNMTAIDDLWPDENYYGRSDHFNFARKGVPILFFFNGVHDDYHARSDELEDIDLDKTSRIGRLAFWLGLEVADADQAPVWDQASRDRIVGR